MPQLKIGIQLAALREPFKKALHTAALLGADAVEIDARTEVKPQELTESALRQVRKMLDDANLRVAAVTFRTRRGYNVADELDRRVAATKAAMRMAYDLGASVVVNHVGEIPAEPQGPEWNTLLESLTDLGRYGQHIGAMLCAETGTESGDDLLRLIAALPEGSLGVNFDPGNLIVNSHSPIDAAQKLASHVRHIHAKDGVRDRAQGRGVEVPLGRGTADFPLLMSIFEQQGYRGYWTIERENARDPQSEIGVAVKYLRSL